ncbi:MAG: hypothetical protein KF708_16085 [Pirellulales bacterium]|nr:hypothetical protein [Pirellulales bacterium]
MRKVSLAALAGAIVLAVLTHLCADTAHAIPPFKKEFDTKYVKKDSTDAVDVQFVALVEEVKCNVCHKGKDKKMRNAYGDALAELLDKKEDAKNVEKIQKALDEVAGKPSNPADEKSPTFGDLIKKGELPGGKEE